MCTEDYELIIPKHIFYNVAGKLGVCVQDLEEALATLGFKYKYKLI